jgi:hypothetical protein
MIYRKVMCSMLGVLACVLTASPSHAGHSEKLTIEVCCASQKQIDADHQITATVSDGTNTVSITVPVQKGTTAQAVADAVQAAFDVHGVATTGPTANTNPRYASGTAWDITMPDGFSIKKSGVQRLTNGVPGPDDGHMKLHDNKKTGSSGVTNPPPGFSSLYIHQLGWSGSTKAMEIYVSGCRADGSRFTQTQLVEYGPNDVMPAYKLQPIGSFLAGMGMTVTYPSTSELSVDILPSGLNVYEVDFTIYQDTQPTDDGLWNESFELDAVD